MSRTISSSLSSQVTLSYPGDNPTTITSSGTISTSSGIALYAPGNGGGTNSWTIDNGGLIHAAGTGTTGIGIQLGSGTAGVTNNLVTNESTGSIYGYFTGIEMHGSGTVVNRGAITAYAAYAHGVNLLAGGLVTNAATGVIVASSGDGVTIAGTTGTVTNSGTIVGATGFGGYGVNLAAGGSLTNAQTGYINFVGFGTTGTGTLINSGTILSNNTRYTVFFKAGGSLTNTQSGYIGGPNGVYITNAGTVINQGTILATYVNDFGIRFEAGGTVITSGTIGATGGGANAHAVYFYNGTNNLLGLEAGYHLIGGASGRAGFTTNTLELIGTLSAPLTVTFNTLGLVNFQDLLFGTAGYDTLKVTNTSGTLGVTISGFDQTSEIVDLTGIGTNGTISYHSASKITVTGSLGSATLKLDPSDAAGFTTVSDGASGTDLIACFRRGTLIRTEAGEVPVETLAIGDRVLTASGTARPIKWIGRRAYDARFITGNDRVLPIRIEAGALGDDVPGRDLFVSPEHAIVIDGLYLPARLLVNGATIRQVDCADRLEYFHVELDSHDVIFAEGAAAETFVDCDNRGMFYNAAEFAELYPDAGPADREPYAALLALAEPGLPAVRARLLARAKSLGRISRDPDLHLLVDGSVVPPCSVSDRTHRFALPAGARAAAIVSRSVVPMHTEAASLDLRRLGVPVEQIVLTGGGLSIEIAPACPALAEGFHEDEGSHRWTDGCAVLPPGLLDCFSGEVLVELRIGVSELQYPIEDAGGAAPVAAAASAAATQLAARG